MWLDISRIKQMALVGGVGLAYGRYDDDYFERPTPAGDNSLAGALIARDTLLQGQSNDQGKVELTDEQNETLKTHYDQAPHQCWLVYADQAREVALDVDKGNWGDLQNLFNAMDAMGYSDRPFEVSAEHADERHASLARKDARTGSPQTLIDKLKDK